MKRMMGRSLVAGIFIVTGAACAGEADTVADTAAMGGAPDTTAAGAATTGATTSPTGFVDPDAATREQLVTIPGITAATADAVIGGRPYQNMTAVDQVLARANLSEQQRDTVYTRLWKPIDLNSASRQEIELIPGVGPRMRHEFEEYRPYRSMDQFRREIGKYVDPTEVARLEKYVMIRQ